MTSFAKTAEPTPLLEEGEITEIVGRLSSGRTSLLVRCLRDATVRGGIVALVDTHDVFDGASAARAGVDLRRLLWVRCGGRRAVATRAADLLVRCPGFALIAVDFGETAPHLTLTGAYRWKLAARRHGAALVILGARRLAGPGAALAVETVRRGLEWTGPSAIPRRLARVAVGMRVLRCRGGAPPAGEQVRWLSA
jgi:hypothetical protein